MCDRPPDATPSSRRRGLLFGKTGDKLMGRCNAGVTYHPGAVEAWEEAGHKIAACAKPKS